MIKTFRILCLAYSLTGGLAGFCSAAEELENAFNNLLARSDAFCIHLLQENADAHAFDGEIDNLSIQLHDFVNTHLLPVFPEHQLPTADTVRARILGAAENTEVSAENHNETQHNYIVTRYNDVNGTPYREANNRFQQILGWTLDVNHQNDLTWVAATLIPQNNSPSAMYHPFFIMAVNELRPIVDNRKDALAEEERAREEARLERIQQEQRKREAAEAEAQAEELKLREILSALNFHVEGVTHSQLVDMMKRNNIR